MNAAINEMSGDHRPDKTMGAVAQPAARNLARPAGGQLPAIPSSGSRSRLQSRE